ncbi:MAG: glycoside hydrolase family 16 protein [Oscillospiraceae bacterium]|nr:glycoside hydrolase family 16 protein [Oscillospiraceae bacterium]
MNKEKLDYKGYIPIFEEHFDGECLDRSVWNVETHEVGWVNEEWQEYIDSDAVLYQKDSILTIRPVKEKNRYYSGRISTAGKRFFTYGIFEARFRTPKGKGFLPAFWLMSEGEQDYGCWPRCGEIDIMEVIGSKPSEVFSTIHYGLPHKQTQGGMILEVGDFSQDFHTVSLLWEMGEIRWYMDGKEYFSVSDWYATDKHNFPADFPAPFDHAMYLVLNLAIGGEWVGDPDDSTDFENEVFEIDYVKVYQKEM